MRIITAVFFCGVTLPVLAASREITITIQKSQVNGQNLDLIYEAKNNTRRHVDIASVKCILFDSDNKVITIETSSPQDIVPNGTDFVETEINLKGRTISFDRAECRATDVYYKD